MTAAIRRTLLADRESLTCRLAGLDAPEGSAHAQSSDAAAATEAREGVAGDRERLRARVQAIDAALSRVDAGDYGFCVDCGNPIPPKRLATLPETQTCLSCQQQRERGEDDR